MFQGRLEGTKDEDRDDDSPPKVFWDGRKCRSIVPTINYMATDVPDLQVRVEGNTPRNVSAAVMGDGQTRRQVLLGP